MQFAKCKLTKNGCGGKIDPKSRIVGGRIIHGQVRIESGMNSMYLVKCYSHRTAWNIDEVID